LECHVQIKYTINSLRTAPNVYVTTNGRYPSIFDAAHKFHDDTKIIGFYLSSHHVVLRSKEKIKFSSMSSNPLSYSGTLSIVYLEPYIHFLCSSGSHLCDTNGCLRKDHLELELFSLNASRKVCSGVVLMVAGDIIIDVNPCVHATTHPNYKPGGNDLDFSCRTVRVEYMPV
jgi:hypothetical protein